MGEGTSMSTVSESERQFEHRSLILVRKNRVLPLLKLHRSNLGGNYACIYFLKITLRCVSGRLTHVSRDGFGFIVHQGVEGVRRHGEQVTRVSRVCAAKTQEDKRFNITKRHPEGSALAKNTFTRTTRHV